MIRSHKLSILTDNRVYIKLIGFGFISLNFWDNGFNQLFNNKIRKIYSIPKFMYQNSNFRFSDNVSVLLTLVST